MTSAAGGTRDHAPVYDVILTDTPPAGVCRRFPTMTVRAVGTQTALRSDTSEPDQLDDLLEALSELRLPLVDLHLLREAPGVGAAYEVHVDGVVGAPLLRYLRWSHRVVPCHARVQIRAAVRELGEFLAACSENGVHIERVRLVTPVEHPAR
jgi:hypothetical protein